MGVRGPDVAKIRKSIGCSIREARGMLERFGTVEAALAAAEIRNPKSESRFAEKFSSRQPVATASDSPASGSMGVFVQVHPEDLPQLRACRDRLYALGKAMTGVEGYAMAETAVTIDSLLEQVDDHYGEISDNET